MRKTQHETIVILHCQSNRLRYLLLVLAAIVIAIGRCPVLAVADETQIDRRLLYVAVPGIRNYLEYGGHGLLVFDIDNSHKFVKRIPTSGLDAEGKPDNVK